MKRGISWIAVDWGSTHVRAWALSEDHRVVAEARSDKGMNTLSPDQFEPALIGLIDDWLPAAGRTTVVACGMVGARQGWVEANYVATPCPPLNADRFMHAPANDPRIDVQIVPGLRQNHPADVMRGEETQIAGLLSERAAFEGTICMPGTHCKWAEIKDDEVVGFKTSMTGEIFALLKQTSILRHSLTGDGFDMDTFQSTVTDALLNPHSAVMNLFSIRAGDLLHDEPPGISRAKLSAYLIAAEISAAKPLWNGSDVVLLGAAQLVGLYSVALLAAGAHVEIVDGEGLTVSGLTAAKKLMEEPEND